MYKKVTAGSLQVEEKTSRKLTSRRKNKQKTHFSSHKYANYIQNPIFLVRKDWIFLVFISICQEYYVPLQSN